MEILFPLRMATLPLPCCRQGSNSAAGGTAADSTDGRACLLCGQSMLASTAHSDDAVPSLLFIEINNEEN